MVYNGRMNKMNLYSMWKDFYNNTIVPYGQKMLGYDQYKNTQSSLQAQIDYDQYLRTANERALADWNKNVGSKGRTIKYPEFSYAGQMYRADTSIARAGFDYNTSYANYVGNLPYRSAGLYGIGSRLFRTL